MKYKKLFTNPIAFAIAIAFTTSAQAVGTGVITSGSGTINKGGNSVTVNQNSDKLVINWNNMDIGKNESMHFNQPNQNSAVLNRVNSIDPTLIQGVLRANGQVFIVNPNGVLIGNGAAINVGSLVASSLDIKDKDFMQGNLKFSGKGKGSVVNKGDITSLNSTVLIGAGQVSNEGHISAKYGNAVLASGEDITLSFPTMGKIKVKITKGSLTALVNNGGMIVTPNGSIALTAWATDTLTRSVINNSGTLEANHLISSSDGVYLTSQGNGNIDIAGKASGNILEARGHSINVKDNAVLTSKRSMVLAANGKDGHVNFDKSTINGNVSITADNVLTGGSAHQPTFLNGSYVSINSNSKNLTVGDKSVNQPSQIKTGQGVISEGLVKAVTKSKAMLSVTTDNGDINLNNNTLDYGDMTLASRQGNVNVNSVTKGKSLHITAGNQFIQKAGADISMTDSVSVHSGKSITQKADITAGKYASLISMNGDVIQEKGKKTLANEINYQGNTVKIDGLLRSDHLTLAAKEFTQGSQSILDARKSFLSGGGFDLRAGETHLDSIYLSANSMDLNTNFDTEIAENSYLSKNLNINSTKDIQLSGMVVNGVMKINATNINSTPYATLISGKGMVLNAKNNINIGNIYSGGDDYTSPIKGGIILTGNDITTGDLQLKGDVKVTASNNLKVKDISGDSINLHAKGDINVASVSSDGAITLASQKNITSNNYLSGGNVDVNAVGTIRVHDINSRDDMTVSAGGDVILNGNLISNGNVSVTGNNILTQAGNTWYGPYISSEKNTTLTAKNSLNVNNIYAGLYNYGSPQKGNVTLTGKDISTGEVNASGNVIAAAGNSVSMQNISTDSIRVKTGGDINIGSVSAKGNVDFISQKNISTTGDVSGSDINFDAKGNVVVQNVQSEKNLAIAAGNDVMLGGNLFSGGDIAVSGVNIIANSLTNWYAVSIDSFKNTVLKASNIIDVGNIHAGSYFGGSPEDGNISLSAKQITAASVSANNNVEAIAEKSITMQNVDAKHVKLSANNDINISDVTGYDSVNASSVMGRITFNTLYQTANKNISAAKGVTIHNDYNVESSWPSYPGYPWWN